GAVAPGPRPAQPDRGPARRPGRSGRIRAGAGRARGRGAAAEARAPDPVRVDGRPVVVGTPRLRGIAAAPGRGRARRPRASVAKPPRPVRARHVRSGARRRGRRGRGPPPPPSRAAPGGVRVSFWAWVLVVFQFVILAYFAVLNFLYALFGYLGLRSV